jgi:hypothetical protein
MVGKKFKKWTVLRQVDSGKSGRNFECKCECGTIKILPAWNITNPHRDKSCFKCYHSDRGNSCYKSIVGSKRGKWTILKYAKKDSVSKLYCQCECGEKHWVQASKIRGNYSKQCEKCQFKEYSFSPVHGKTATPTYYIWASMRQRCNNPKNIKFKDYGGRGIKICDRWDKFENFLQDMGERPSENVVLDRIDNDGNYEPSNCKWSERHESCNNRRNSPKYSNDYVNGTFPYSLFCDCCVKKIKEYKPS